MQDLLGYTDHVQKAAYNGKSAGIAFRWNIGTNQTTFYGKLLIPDGFTWNTATMGSEPTYTNPDSYTVFYTEDNYHTLTGAGAVFLVANGYGTSFSEQIGYYWLGETSRTYIQFSNSLTNYVTSTNYASCVRLVQEIQ